MAKPGALAKLDDDKALTDLAGGKLLKHIAADFGCSKVAVYKRLSKHPDYKASVDMQADSFVEEAMDMVMNCDADTVNIARARVDAAFKWAAARNPEKWGNKGNGNIVIDLGGALQAISERMQGRGASQQLELSTGKDIEGSASD